MDLIDRYIYAVTKSLPEKQRGDIEKELKTLIDDMIEQYDESETYESRVKKALTELGNPEVLADNYRGSGRHLIGPQIYDKYILVLKIVFGAVFIGISIAVIIESIFSKQQALINVFVQYLATLFSGLLQGFAWTTLVFALIERHAGNRNEYVSKKEEWNIALLPPIPVKKAAIPLSEPIVSIIFSTVFLVLLYSMPQVFAAYIPNDEGVRMVIPVFNLEALEGFRLLFAGIFIFTIIKEVAKLIARRWTLRLALIYSAFSVGSTVLTLMIFTNPSVWNPNFSREVMDSMKLTFDFVEVWSKFTTWFIILIVVGAVIDISTTLYKGIKYGIERF